MGFPVWTLWGMGITAVGTTLMLILAYIAQSPRLLTRLGLSGFRLDLRARTLTGYALALLLLTVGFFLAGVPLGSLSGNSVAEVTEPVPDTNESGAMGELAGSVSVEAPEVSEENVVVDDGTPDSGAFGGPPPAALTETAEAAVGVGDQDENASPEVATEAVLPSSTPTPTKTVTPSPTSSSTPTTTPTPTNTPTPIFDETAMINTGSSTIWVKRMPGGQDHVLLRGGDTIILLPGHANVAGALWREVKTVNGAVGWVLESYLSSGKESDSAGESG